MWEYRGTRDTTEPDKLRYWNRTKTKQSIETVEHTYCTHKTGSGEEAGES